MRGKTELARPVFERFFVPHLSRGTTLRSPAKVWPLSRVRVLVLHEVEAIWFV